MNQNPDIEKIKALIDSRDKTNYELALVLLEGLGISKEKFLIKEYKKFINIRTSDDSNIFILMDYFLYGNSLSILPEALLNAQEHIEEFFKRIKGFDYIYFHNLCEEHLKYLDFLSNTNIKHLGFLDCNINSLPLSIFKMNLDSLYLDNENEHFILPKEIKNLKSLKEFIFYKIPLNQIPFLLELKSDLPNCKFHYP